jgi:hypothetical protein
LGARGDGAGKAVSRQLEISILLDKRRVRPFWQVLNNFWTNNFPSDQSERFPRKSGCFATANNYVRSSFGPPFFLVDV